MIAPQPTDFARHHDVAHPSRTGSQVWRVRTRLDGLLKAGDILNSEWLAGSQYRQDYEVGELGGRLQREGPSSGTGCPLTARLDAVRRLRLARAHIGWVETQAMNALADDLSWEAAGRLQGVRRDIARLRAILAVKHVANYYALGESRTLR